MTLCAGTLTLSAAACSGSNLTDPGPRHRVQLSLSQNVFQPGNTVVATVSNTSSVTLEYAYSFCAHVLQKQLQDGTWNTVDGASAECTLQVAYLSPGQSIPFQFRLPADLVPGVYREAMPEPHPSNATSATAATIATPAFSVNSPTLP